MNPTWKDSVVLISSSEPDNKRFGTGFIIHQDENTSFILTCAHVISEVGGENSVRIDNIPVRVIADGTTDHVDLAVLQSKERLERPVMQLRASGQKSRSFTTAGFQFFDGDFLIRALSGSLGEQVGLESRKRTKRINAWDMEIESNYQLQPGYSGSPVLNSETQEVIGVVSHRESTGERGLAICVSALAGIWGRIPISLYRSLKLSPDTDQVLKMQHLYDDIKQDWGEAPHVDVLLGRKEDISEISRWAIIDKCRLITVLGMGGIGKTVLATKIAKEIAVKFDFVIWRSLRNAPPITQVISEIILFLSGQRHTDLADSVSQQISQLMKYLSNARCLIILDNVESILHEKQAGHYLEGYEAYGQLIERIGSTQHQSCTILTSREKPREIGVLEGSTGAVRTHKLSGIHIDAGKQLLESKGLLGTPQAWDSLIDLYSGNPLVLNIVSEMIREVYEGYIDEYLDEGAPTFGHVENVLDEQFERLSYLEQIIMFWLAVERETVERDRLIENIFPKIDRRELILGLRSLRRRSLIEQAGRGFTLQNVITEYLTEKLIKQICLDLQSPNIKGLTCSFTQNLISHQSISLINNIPVAMAFAKDYVRQSQERLILAPIVKCLRDYFADSQDIASHLMSIVESHRETHSVNNCGYLTGNILNILSYLNINLTGFDFSNLFIAQAYLRGVDLHDVSFAFSRFYKSVFTDTFGSILSVSISNNGNLLAAGSATGEIRVWQIPDYKQLLICRGHKDWVRSVDFSKDDRYLASGSNDGIVKVWDAQTGRCIESLEGHKGQVLSVKFGGNSHTVISSGSDQTIRIWDLEQSKSKLLEGHNGRVISIDINTNGNLLVSAGDDGIVRIWDLENYKCVKELTGHIGSVRAVTFHKNDSMVISGGEDSSVRLWDIATGENPGIVRAHHESWVRSVACSADGRFIISAGDDHTIRLWDIESGLLFGTMREHTNRIWAIAVSPDDRMIVSGSEDQTIRFWDVKNKHCLNVLEGYSSWFRSIAFNPANENMLASGGDNKTVQLWDTSQEEIIRTLRGHTSRIWSVAFSPNGHILASASDDHTIRLWNIDTGQCIRILTGHRNSVWCVSFSPDGTKIASGSDDRTVRVWNVETGNPFLILEGHDNRIWSIAFSPDGTRIASSSDDHTIRVWNLASGQTIHTLNECDSKIRSISFSSDGKTLAAGENYGTIRFWDTETGKIIETLQSKNSIVWSLRFSPDGNFLACGGGDNIVELWDLQSRNRSSVLRGHSRPIWSVTFTINGYSMASGGEDEQIRIWNTMKGECIKKLEGKKPYRRMDITGAEGLTHAQRITLKTLGAIEAL